jgi:hypothetical protein
LFTYPFYILFQFFFFFSFSLLIIINFFLIFGRFKFDHHFCICFLLWYSWQSQIFYLPFYKCWKKSEINKKQIMENHAVHQHKHSNMVVKSIVLLSTSSRCFFKSLFFFSLPPVRSPWFLFFLIFYFLYIFTSSPFLLTTIS